MAASSHLQGDFPAWQVSILYDHIVEPRAPCQAILVMKTSHTYMLYNYTIRCIQ